MNIKLIVAYDGTAYLGWQKTPMGPSIEESLEHILEKIFQHKIILQAASRTDAGVHANGQVVNFISPKEKVCLNRLKISLNQLLPPDIVVMKVEEAEKDFHPTLDCKEKEYHYYICTGDIQIPGHRFYSWHCPRLHRIEEMRRAAQFFIGDQDFSAFCNLRKYLNYKSFHRYISLVDIQEIGQDRFVFKIRGQNFLYRMVRNMVGTLAYAGRGKIDIAQMPAILASGDRTKAGITAPAHGLFLHSVNY